MTITRRRFAVTAAALSAGSAIAQPKPRPIVIAHRGASGERPESTLEAFRVAIAEGADFIEPDLVATKDGHLVVRHENEISQTTNVAEKPEFAGRATTRSIQGQPTTGWFTEDFTLAELKTLRCRERLPAIRPANTRFNFQEPIPTFQEVLDLAKSETARLKRPIGVYPEMKHPSHFTALGLGLEARLADALKANGLNSANAPVFVQCFDVLPLKTFMTLSKARRIQLLSKDGGPTDVALLYRNMATAEGLKTIAAYANGVGPEWPMVIPQTAEGGLGPPTSLVADAHAAGLAVHPWTVRAENAFLPKALRKGASPAEFGDVDAVYKALYAAGVDGLFSDFPGLAVKARV